MARSTKIQKIVTDALATRVTATESRITSIQARNLIDVGDNVSDLTNDANYQTQAQVQAKLDALINSAPGTLDTLGEIATALAAEDSAIAALTAVNTTQNTEIANLQAADNSLVNLINALQGVLAQHGGRLTSAEQRLSIRRFNLTTDLSLDISDRAVQNLINQSGTALTVTLPLSPPIGNNFEVINNSTSTQNISFAGETVIPGTRHAVQWDGTEWVVM